MQWYSHGSKKFQTAQPIFVNMVRILILCTGNSCRSQMAEGFLKSFDPDLEVYSAGTEPSGEVHPNAMAVMQETGIDISEGLPKHVDQFIEEPFDYVITVCDDARESCPVFTGKVRHRLHLGFEDPARATGTKEEVMGVFRMIRDQIREAFYQFYSDNLKNR